MASSLIHAVAMLHAQPLGPRMAERFFFSLLFFVSTLPCWPAALISTPDPVSLCPRISAPAGVRLHHTCLGGGDRAQP